MQTKYTTKRLSQKKEMNKIEGGREAKRNEQNEKGKVAKKIEEKIEQKIWDILKEEKKNTNKINNEVMKLIDKEIIIDYCTNKKVNAKSLITKYLHTIHYLMNENIQLKKNQEKFKSEILQKNNLINQLEDDLKKKNIIIEKALNNIKFNNLMTNDTSSINCEINKVIVESKIKTDEESQLLDTDKKTQIENKIVELEKTQTVKQNKTNSNIITSNSNSSTTTTTTTSSSNNNNNSNNNINNNTTSNTSSSSINNSNHTNMLLIPNNCINVNSFNDVKKQFSEYTSFSSFFEKEKEKEKEKKNSPNYIDIVHNQSLFLKSENQFEKILENNFEKKLENIYNSISFKDDKKDDTLNELEKLINTKKNKY